MKLFRFLTLMAEAAAAEGTPTGGAPAEPAATNTPVDGGEPPAEPNTAAADEGGDGEGSDTATDGDDPADNAGAEYADFTLPEGFTLDQPMMDQFAPVMKELGLDQAAAQKLVDAQVSWVQAQQQQASEGFQNQVNDWYEASTSDKEFGGDKFEQSAKIAADAANKFGTPELKTLLQDYGIGNHPEMVRFMYRVGKALQEDNPGNNGGNNVTDKPDRVSLLYPEN